MQEFVVLLTAIVAGGATVTKVVDLIRNAVDRTNKLPAVTWNVAALAVGVAAALGWRLDVTAHAFAAIPALQNTRLTGISGQILTGLTFGGAAGFFHEFFDYLSSRAKASFPPVRANEINPRSGERIPRA